MISGSGSPFLRLDQVTRKFPGTTAPAVDALSLEVRRGEVYALLGPSGCGKSTTLRIIAGLELPDSGAVYLDNRDITRSAPERRGMGVVFQSYALFPHLTVAENVAFGPRVQGVRGDELRRSVDEALALVQLSGLHARSVAQLSGGQQQRVAIARAVASRPAALLLDEPLSNLDAALREETRETLRELLTRLGVTAVFVTHDQADALAFADRIALMRTGKIVEEGTPESLYLRPATAFGATFLGAANVLAARVIDGVSVELAGRSGTPRVALAVGEWADDTPRQHGADVHVVIRPESVRLASDPGEHTRAADIVSRVFLGASVRLVLELEGGARIRALVPDAPRSGRVWVRLAPESVRVVPSERDA